MVEEVEVSLGETAGGKEDRFLMSAGGDFI